MKNPAEKKPAIPLTRYITISLLSVLLFHLITIQCFSQEFGRFSPGIKWQQINTPAVRVIFPKGLEPQANRVANNILYINQNNRTSIGQLSKKLDLVLNNQGVISNGYFTLMPFRSEFFTIPMQNGNELGTTEWLDILSVHEYRHALQYMNLRRGFNKVAWYLAGDIGWGSIINLTVPGWFLEGDAVATETALSSQGRGRLPSFRQLSKSLLLNDRQYSYMKARNGSYRDMVPDPYEFGYLLCSYGRENFGNDFWLKVMRQTSSLSFLAYPFSFSVLTRTGMTTRQFYSKALSDYKNTWSKEISEQRITPAAPLSKASRTVTSYRFPVCLPDGNILVYKESYKEIGAIYRIGPGGTETRICTTGISLDPYFTVSGNLLTWTEVTWDPRYSAKSYSDIVVYHSDTNKKVYLTRKQRYFSPALSPDGRLIVAVESEVSGNCRLIILDRRTGEVKIILPNPEKFYYTYPKWDADGKSILSSVRSAAGNSLIIRQLITDGSVKKLSPEFNHYIGEVLVTGDAVIFSASFSGTNNLYSLDRGNGTIRQLTGSKFGATCPAISADGRKLVYSDFNYRGYRLAAASTDSLLMTPIDPVPLNKMKMFDHNYFQKEGGAIFDKIPDQTPDSKPYQPLKHAGRLHSWMISNDYFSAGINLISDNVLNNLHAEAGFDYYYNENSPGFNALIEYGGIFPVLSAGVSRHYRSSDQSSVLFGSDTARLISLDDNLSLGISVPLNFTRGKFYRYGNIRVGYQYISNKDLRSATNSRDKTLVVNALSGKISYFSIMKKARQNISSPLGAGLELSANQSVDSENAAQYQAIGDFAVRGIFPNHNLVLSAGYKYESVEDRYHFMDLFIYPRGYPIAKSNRMLTLQAGYHFPIAYPDFGFWGILYCSRIRASLFADYGHASTPAGINEGYTGNLFSTGTELILDIRWLNLVEIPLGIRFSLLLTPDKRDPGRKTAWELVIPVIRL